MAIDKKFKLFSWCMLNILLTLIIGFLNLYHDLKFTILLCLIKMNYFKVQEIDLIESSSNVSYLQNLMLLHLSKLSFNYQQKTF